MADANDDTASMLLRALAGLMAVPLRALAVMKLWGWFVVPALGVKPIGMVMGYGLMLFVSFLTYQMPEELGNQESLRSQNMRAGVHILAPLFALFGGWVATLLM